MVRITFTRLFSQGSQICEVDDLAPVDSRREDMECSCDSYSSAPQDEEGDYVCCLREHLLANMLTYMYMYMHSTSVLESRILHMDACNHFIASKTASF